MASPTLQQVDTAKLEHIVMHFFAKSLQIILESRLPLFGSPIDSGGNNSAGSSTFSSSSRARECWFNLFLGDCCKSLEKLEPALTTILQPMVVDVLLIQQNTGRGNTQPTQESSGHQRYEKTLSSCSDVPVCWITEGTSVNGTLPGTVLERWVVQYDCQLKSFVGSGPGLKVSSGFSGGSGGNWKRGSCSGMGSDEMLVMGGVDGLLASGLLSLQGEQGAFVPQGSGGVGKAAKMVGTGVPIPHHPKHIIELSCVYKRMIIVLRSLYCRTRLLPAYRLFRLAISSSYSRSFTLSYRVSSLPSPLPETDEKDMSLYSFTPLEIPYGRICLSVAYRHITAVTALEVTPPIHPQIISDYVDSPATDPLKRFPTDSHFLGRRGVQVVSLPSSVPISHAEPSFAQHHSWSGGVDKLQSLPSPSFGGDESPSRSYPFDINPSPPSHFPFSSKHIVSDHSYSPCSSPSQPSFPSVIHLPIYQKENSSHPINIRGNYTPPFSPSPSLSPSASSYAQDCNVPKGQSGSIPVNIPKPYSLSHSPFDWQSRISLPPLSPRNRKAESCLRVLSAKSTLLTAQLLTSSVSPSDCKVTLLTSSESPLQICTSEIDHFEQVVSDGEIGTVPKFGGENLSCVNIPRGSSKDSSYDNQDDEEFSCPLAVDDEATTEQFLRVHSLRLKGKAFQPSNSIGQGGIIHQMSQDAAVGILIRLLKSAAPLRSDLRGSTLQLHKKCEAARGYSHNLMCSRRYEPNVEVLQPTLGSSIPRKTATDALEELQAYKGIRDLLYNQSGGKS